jgi:hypothetical protein
MSGPGSARPLQHFNHSGRAWPGPYGQAFGLLSRSSTRPVQVPDSGDRVEVHGIYFDVIRVS